MCFITVVCFIPITFCFKNKNEIYTFQVREQAISTCGHLCVGQPDIPHKKRILEAFLALAKEVSLK